MNEIIAEVIAYGSWRGMLNRTQIAELRLKGHQVRVMSDIGEGDLFDVEVS
jgi:hypothetical protein